MAGASHRAFWRCAWSPPLGPRLTFVWHAQYTEPPAGAAARRGWLSCGRRAHRASWRSCGRAWPPLGRRLAFLWQARYTKPSAGAAARVPPLRRPPLGPRLAFVWQARATQSLLEELGRAWPPHGPRLAFVWQARYTEPSAGAAARVAAAWAAAGFRVAGALHRASWRSCGARGRRWAAAGFHLISSHLISSHLISSHLSLCRSGGERHTQNFKLSYKSPAGVAAVSGLVRAIMTISARFGAQYVQ